MNYICSTMEKMLLKLFIFIKQLSKLQKFICAGFVLFLLFFLSNSLFISRQKQLINPRGLLYNEKQVLQVSAALLTYTDTLMSFSYFKDTTRRDALSRQLLLFYKLHNFRPIWFPAGVQTPKTDTLLKILQQADLEGLNPNDYFVDSIVNISQRLIKNTKNVDLKALAKLDIYTSVALLSFGLHKKVGKVSLYYQKKTLNVWQDDQHFQDSLALYFYKNIHQKGLLTTFNTTITTNPQYYLLKKELARYLTFKSLDIAKIIYDKDSSYTVSDSSEAVFYLKKHLQATGDLSKQVAPTGIYDSAVYLAVKRFQYRHAMEETGIANKETLSKVNTIADDEYINKIRLNLEKTKWQKYQVSARKIVVNIPDFRVYYFENQHIINSMRVVVGKKLSPTPIFSDTLEYVVFNPTWGVPYSIASKEMLYKLRRNANYLANNGYILRANTTKSAVDSKKVDWFKVTENNFPYSIMQKSGKDNSLGKIKFLFPNRFQVYMHDTPEQRFFLRAKRAYSHGCVRLQCPETMAFYVLQGVKSWDKKQITESLAKNTIQHIALPTANQIPVNISYQTAWLNSVGQLHLREDIYNYDKEHLELFLR